MSSPRLVGVANTGRPGDNEPQSIALREFDDGSQTYLHPDWKGDILEFQAVPCSWV